MSPASHVRRLTAVYGPANRWPKKCKNCGQPLKTLEEMDGATCNHCFEKAWEEKLKKEGKLPIFLSLFRTLLPPSGLFFFFNNRKNNNRPPKK